MRLFTILALALAIGLAGAVSPFASSAPDGLEKVAAEQRFLDEATADKDAPAAGYAIAGIDDPRLATGLAGFAGTLAVFGLATLVVRPRARRRA